MQEIVYPTCFPGFALALLSAFTVLRQITDRANDALAPNVSAPN